jgi:hypothetical protein
MKINGHDLYYSIINGSQKVLRLKEHLNRINVFPVPDGDTGSNLTHTMNAIINKSEHYESVEKTLHTISRSALEGARGNSGVIMAEYIGGLYRDAVNSTTLSEEEFVHLFSAAYKSAFKAVSKPVDGTILTVMHDFSISLHHNLNQYHDLIVALSKAHQKAQSSLQSTQYRMKILRDAGVVDSGANGFVAFIEGITEFFKNGRRVFEVKKVTAPFIDNEHINTLSENPLKQRYCYEILFETRRTFDRSILEAFGESIIVAGRDDLVKVHIHTNEPHELVQEIGKYGIVLEQKLDDMDIQQSALFNRKSNIAIITDSIADLPKSYIEDHNIFILPMNILIDNIEYLDRMTLTTQQFFTMTDETSHFPRSAMPKIPDIQRILSFASDHYDEIIILSVSSGLSGTHNLINRILKENQYFGKDIRLIDTRLNSGAQGLIVQKAVALAEDKHTLDFIEHTIHQAIKTAMIFVSVTDFTYMIRGGRVSPFKGKLAKFLNLKPIVSLDSDGNGIAFAKAFSQTQNMNKMIKIVKKIQTHSLIDSYCIVHGSNYTLARKYQQIFHDIIGFEASFIEEVSPVVAISSGRGAIAIALTTKERFK